MYSREVLDEVVLKSKIESIMLDIIGLKQENRNIGAKAKVLFCCILDNDLKAFTCKETERCTYKARVKRDLKTIEYLEKLQKVNSRLINKHRSKVKALREELGALKGAE